MRNAIAVSAGLGAHTLDTETCWPANLTPRKSGFPWSHGHTRGRRVDEVKIYISGLHGGANPSPGIGTARSLRSAFPRALLIGVDYSTRSTGIHWPDFDRIWLQRGWDELDLVEYGQRIRDLMEPGVLWISGLDLETVWLAETVASACPGVLVPPPDAVKSVAKPLVHGLAELPFRRPNSIELSGSESEVYAFCRQHGWPVWVKGPYYEARRVETWSELEKARAGLSAIWTSGGIFVQEHIAGYEESIAFSAYRGRLLAAVRMRKHETTWDGKTWAGEVCEVDEEVRILLAKALAAVGWTGGGEIELVMCRDGTGSMMECNPRFPAWIYGATLAGHNLVAALVEAAAGLPPANEEASIDQFVRVVLEVPVRPEFPLAPPPQPGGYDSAETHKHPSGMPLLARRLGECSVSVDPVLAEGRGAPLASGLVPEDIRRLDMSNLRTPCCLFRAEAAAQAFSTAAGLRFETFDSRGIALTVAYSVKTNPDPRFLNLALEAGLFAEAISQYEVKKALDMGFRCDQIILNGPGKWWPEIHVSEPFYAVFCDSLKELELLLQRLQHVQPPRILGVRLRPPGITSRFGVAVEDYDVFLCLAALIEAIPSSCRLGVHFHTASSAIGVRKWSWALQSVMAWCDAIEDVSGRCIDCVDVGGGWAPEDWPAVVMRELDRGLASFPSRLAGLKEVILEPGKALVQPALVVVTGILEVRAVGGCVEVVVDGSIAELPDLGAYPHRILYLERATGVWRVINRGKDRILGRLCMENDTLASAVQLPESVSEEDILLFCDSGAYDRSMAHDFGRGEVRHLG